MDNDWYEYRERLARYHKNNGYTKKDNIIDLLWEILELLWKLVNEDSP